MSQDVGRLSGKVALVTGAGQGLGRAHALKLAAEGASLVVNDVVVENAQSVVAEIERNGGTAFADTHSVSDPDGARAMVDETLERYGRLDILVMNAGIVRWGEFSGDLGAFRDVVDVNLWGSVLPVHAAWSRLLEQGYGRIILTSSQAGLWGQQSSASYATTKAAMVGFARALADEVPEGSNVRINVIAPAAATPMSMASGAIDEETAKKMDPEQVSRLVAYLVSDAVEESGMIFNVGNGVARRVRILESPAVPLPDVVTELAPEFDDMANGPAEPASSWQASPSR